MNSKKSTFNNVGRKIDDKVIETPKLTGNKYEDEISLAIYNSLLEEKEEKEKNSKISKEEIRKKRICYFVEKQN